MASRSFYPGCIAIMTALWLLQSCTSVRHTNSSGQGDSGYCYPTVVFTYDSSLQPLDSIAMLRCLPEQKKYSRHSLMVANAAGVLMMLKDMSVASPGAAYQQKQNQFLTRLLLVETELESMAAELDCEGERADQLAGFLEQRENKRVKKLTIASIGMGALAGIGNAVFSSHSAGVAAAVIGGGLSAGLGLAALLEGRKTEFYHARNLLSDIWNVPESSAAYPPAVWYMLSEKFFSNSQQASLAANLRRRWVTYEGLNDTGEGLRRQKLLFGAGGPYSSDDLRARARMVNQVQAAVKLMNQDLQGLVEEVIRENK